MNVRESYSPALEQGTLDVGESENWHNSESSAKSDTADAAAALLKFLPLQLRIRRAKKSL